MTQQNTTTALGAKGGKPVGVGAKGQQKLEDLYKSGSERRRMVTAVDTIKLIGFRLADEEFVIEIERVKEIGKMPLVTRVSSSPSFVEGIANLRGDILQILNFHKIMNLPSTEITDQSRIIVLDDKQVLAAIIVDSVSEVIEVERNAMQPPPEIIAGERARFIKGIIKHDKRRSILWLDCASIYAEYAVPQSA